MLSPLQENNPKKRNFKSLAIILVIVLIFGLVFARPVWGVYHYGTSAQKFILKAESSLKEGSFKEGSLYLQMAHQDFLKAEKNVHRLAWTKRIPWLGHQIVALDALLSSAVGLTSSLQDLSNVASSVLVPTGNTGDKIQDGDKGHILKTLSESTALLREMSNKLEEANNELDSISTVGLLPQISKTINLMKEKLPTMQNAVDELILVSRILPDLAGYNQEKTYLFLFQNNTELRPSGGFLGTYGILKLKDGEIKEFFTDDTYNLDKEFTGKVETPKPYQIYNKRFDWYFRDSNWAPDFPTAAAKAEWFYHLEGGQENLDGVIAITPTVIERILKLTGPITVEGYPYEFNAENFTDQLEFHVEQNFYKFESKTYRKNIVGKMGETLIAKILNSPRGQLLDLFSVIAQSFSEKQFLVYLNNSEAQKTLASANWDGRAQETDGDYFWYIDCNMASLKSDPKVKRTIDYEVNWDGTGEPVAKLKMTYNHTGDFDWKTTRYRTYARVYVPQGSKFVAASGNESDVDVYQELGKTVFAFFKVTEPGDSESVTLEYKLPAGLAQSPYHLYVQKQAGTVDHKLNVKINWQGKTREFATDLTKDREFSVN